ncbi:TPA: aldehyde dehydrogenase family protein, partial [Neisseria gonorrhoeae]
FELNNLNELQREVFGPVLHVVRYRADELDNVIDQINSKGYALTHGVHSRIEGTVRHIRSRIEAGNVYVNRNIVGAVVGVQPFGGHGLSGTGPKAGGSFYLQKLTRIPEWVAPTLSQIGQADEAALKRLEALIHKLPFNAEEKKAAAAALGHARIRTLRRAETVLTGPTGERNSISWHAPKRVWIHGGSTVQAFAALTGLAASGVQAVVEPDSPLASYTADLEGLLLVNGKPETAGISHVAALSPLDSARKQELAAHDGALIRVLPSENGLDILQVFEEISCSVNTTAAGGNAGLMAVAD